LEGKKGVLWWQIHRILKEKGNKRPQYLFLENVDRLLKSPVNQRGRDFAIMLASLNDLGYAVEWRVINAADYGMPQRRRRTFFVGYHKSSPIFKRIKDPINWLKNEGVFACSFEANLPNGEFFFPFTIQGDLADITEKFNVVNRSDSPFLNSGLMINREVWSVQVEPAYEGSQTLLKDILQKESEVPKEYFLDEKELDKWIYLKGSKKEPRKKSNGEIFYYTEGPLPFPDPLDRPARTIITSEGGKTASRFKHVIKQNGKLRRLTPIELERANMFPDNHTLGVNDTKRAFFMGNALVVGVIEKVGLALSKSLAETHLKKKPIKRYHRNRSN
jgi:DNA (cytosine-5)-methyltransferase 1